MSSIHRALTTAVVVVVVSALKPRVLEMLHGVQLVARVVVAAVQTMSLQLEIQII
jgi:hypothetical protein